MAPTSPSCSKKPWRHWRSGGAAPTSTPRSAAAGMRAGFSPRSHGSGRLVALDRDPEAERAASAIDDPAFTFRRAWFSELPETLAELGIAHIDGALLDLGISSPQIDDAERGFSLRGDGPLDMRMDPTRGESAAAFLARADVRELTEVIRDYGEERFAQSIARAIVAARANAPVDRTRQLAEIVAKAVGARTRGDWRQDPATRTFQALRIFVNRELAGARADAAAHRRAAGAGRTPRGDQLPLARGSHRQALHGVVVAAMRRRPGARAAPDRRPAAAGRAARARRARDPRVRRRGRAQSARAQRDAARRRAHRASAAGRADARAWCASTSCCS